MAFEFFYEYVTNDNKMMYYMAPQVNPLIPHCHKAIFDKKETSNLNSVIQYNGNKNMIVRIQFGTPDNGLASYFF